MVLIFAACTPPAPPGPSYDLTLVAGPSALQLHPAKEDAGLLFAADVTAQFTNELPSNAVDVTVDSVVFSAGNAMKSDGFEIAFAMADGGVARSLSLVPAGEVLTIVASGRAEPLLGWCGSPVHVSATVSCQKCKSPAEVSWDVTPDCLLDNRADDLLALPLQPAANRPCGATLSAGTTNFRYGYDESGRLKIVDMRLGDALKDREIYSYNQAGTLATKLSVAPTARTIYRRLGWTYEAGVATAITSDGWFDDSTRGPDGVPDRIDTLVLENTTWRVNRTTGPSVPEWSLTFNDANRSWKSSTRDMAGSYAGTPPPPNAWVALPDLELMWRLHVLTDGKGVATWSGEKLISVSGDVSLTFLYSCP